MYYFEKKALGKKFKVIEEIKIGSAKMKVGDILTPIDYGSGITCHIIKFINKRLPKNYFTIGTYAFKRITKEEN